MDDLVKAGNANITDAQIADVRMLSIDTEVGKHCIQITDYDKQLKNIENLLEERNTDMFPLEDILLA